MKTKENIFLKKAVPIALTLSCIGFFVIILFSMILPFNDCSFNSSPLLFSQYGDFIGGFVGSIFSLAAILLLYKTLITQQESIANQETSIKNQKSIFELEMFEKTFFNLLKTQNEIVNSIRGYYFKLDDDLKVSETIVIGREFFNYSQTEIKKIWFSIEKNTTYIGKYEDNDKLKNEIYKKIEEIKKSKKLKNRRN